MTKEEYDALQPGTLVVCKYSSGLGFIKDNVYITSGKYGDNGIDILEDSLSHTNNGWTYSKFDLLPPKKVVLW